MAAKKPVKLETLRHSTAHILAAAVKELWPETKLGIGPVIENGFYYDFLRKKEGPFQDNELARIEETMRKIIARKEPFKKLWLPTAEAKKIARKNQEPFKQELISELASKRVKRVSFYQTGEHFTDLCAGPHVRSTADIPAHSFKLLRTASAYWRGSEKNPQLSRIYGTVFFSKKELDDYLALQQELERRDHRKLGTALDLFSFHDVAPGAAFWHPKGMIIIKELEKYWRRAHEARGYEEISTPIMVKKELFEKSGHWAYYRENMFHFDMEGETFVLKPMNCPESTFVYNAAIRSFRDLPLRLSEIGRLHRNERSGTLGGLLRVRQITMDDAHIYCRPDQVEQEITTALELVKDFYALFGFTPKLYLATKPDKALGAPTLWRKAEATLRATLQQSGMEFGIKAKDGAFYGPKIDIHISDALGRDWQLATVQLDLLMLPERFDLWYVDRDGKKKRPMVIHRAIFGSFERFIGILLEHTAGDLPLWLAPVQMQIIPISEKHRAYGEEIVAELRTRDIRAELSEPTETLGKRIRAGELAKIPYLGIVGDKEIEAHTISVRERKGGNLGAMPLERVLAYFKDPVAPKP